MKKIFYFLITFVLLAVFSLISPTPAPAASGGCTWTGYNCVGTCSSGGHCYCSGGTNSSCGCNSGAPSHPLGCACGYTSSCSGGSCVNAYCNKSCPCGCTDTCDGGYCNNCPTCQFCNIGATQDCTGAGETFRTCVTDLSCPYSSLGSWSECGTASIPSGCDGCSPLGGTGSCGSGGTGTHYCIYDSDCGSGIYGSWGTCFYSQPTCPTECNNGCEPDNQTCLPYCTKSCPGSYCVSDPDGGHCYETCDSANCPAGQYCVPTTGGGFCENTPYCTGGGTCSNSSKQFLTCSTSCGGQTAGGISCGAVEHSCAIGCEYDDIVAQEHVKFDCSSYCVYSSTCSNSGCDSPIPGNNQCGGCSQVTPNLRCCSGCRRMTGQVKCGTDGWYPECSDVDPTCGGCGGNTGPTIPPSSSPTPSPSPTPTPVPGPWWQVKDSDVQSAGDLLSNVPVGSYFGILGTGGFPGVPAYGGNTWLTNTNVSETGWLVESSVTNSKIYNYDYFANQIPDEITAIISTVDIADVEASLTSGGTPDANNYYWYKYDGVLNGGQALTLPAIDFGARKVILMVDGADVNITGNINLTVGQGFFAVVVKGNINVDPGVGGGGVNLEGLYFTDGTFSDGVGDTQLWMRGSVVANGGINMQRELGLPTDLTTPSELFVYAPDQILLFPKVFGSRKINWKEVAP